MKKLVLMSAFLAVGSIGHASEIGIAKVPASGVDSVKAFYSIDDESKKVDLNLAVRAKKGTDFETTYEKIPFDGLHYDPVESKIILTHDGKIINCAKVSEEWGKKIITDENCKIVSKKIVLEDREYQKRQYYKIAFEEIGKKKGDPDLDGKKKVDPELDGKKKVDPTLDGKKKIDPEVVGKKKVDPELDGKKKVDPEYQG